ncbi:uncharacterized protein ACRADG_008801 [Cochliomyia hominivorax]
MSSIKFLFAVLMILSYCALNEGRSYNNGLIFYNLENHQIYLPPTISVSRGRGLAKFKYSPRGSIWSTFGRPCECKGPLCGCCVGIKVKQYNFDQKMCANVSYVPRKEEIQLEVFLNDTANAKYGISARDPSPLCIPIMMGIPMSMCIKMSNVGLQGDNLNMCMDFLVRLASTELFEMHFQCMKVGLQGASWVGADGNPVIPPSEGKIKDKSNNESDEYYEDTDEAENEEENEIITKEEQKTKDNELMNIMEKEEETEDDLNKAEEEMDYNDIADKVMGIVKEQEQEEQQDDEGMEESDELVKKNEAEGVKPVAASDMQMIVTNIMESIKESNDMNENDMITETAIELSTNKSEMEKVVGVLDGMSETPEMPMKEEEKIESMEKNGLISETSQKPDQLEAPESTNKLMELETLEKSETVLKTPELEGSKLVEEDVTETKESAKEKNVTEDTFTSSEIIKDYTVLESNADIKEKLQLEETQNEQNVENSEKTNDSELEIEQLNEIKEIAAPLQKQTILYDSTTEHINTEMSSNKIEKFEMLINHDAVETTEIDKIDNGLNNSLEIFQQPMETSTEHLMTNNLKPTMPQIATTTSETDNDNSVDNTLTTATIMTTTTTTKSSAMTSTTTKKPIASEENSIAAITFIENTNDPDKTKHDYQGKDDNEDKEIANDNENSDKSHETDSDYEDEEDEEDEEDDEEEESEELEDETTENENVANMPATAANFNNETPITEQLTNTADDIEPENIHKLNESETDNTNNKLGTNKETEEVEDGEDFTDNADDEEANETKEKTDADDSEEEEYDEEYEDYETTTLAVKDLKPIKANDTCCKSTTPSAINDMPATISKEISTPETNPASNTNLQFVSNTNSVISSNDNDMLNIESTTNKMSQIITTKPAATSTSTMHSSSSTSNYNNVMPLPMARQLFALHRQLQQQQQQEQYQYQLLHQYPTYYRQSRHRQHYF